MTSPQYAPVTSDVCKHMGYGHSYFIEKKNKSGYAIFIALCVICTYKCICTQTLVSCTCFMMDAHEFTQ